jgi:hypothetical protein
MKTINDFIKWTLHHTWVIAASYLTGSIAGLLIHGSFGFTMNDEGTYLSNAFWSIGTGCVLALGTGLIQKRLLNKYFPMSFSWVWSLITGFVIAEGLAGFILWKAEIYRGLIGIFNTDNHLPEASIYTLAGLIAGTIQYSLLRPFYKKRFYWILLSGLSWGLLILTSYLGLFALLIGPMLFGAITGLAFYKIMDLKT